MKERLTMFHMLAAEREWIVLPLSEETEIRIFPASQAVWSGLRMFVMKR